MPPVAKNTTEQFFTQVSESLQVSFDLTARIDERVKMLIERQKEIDEQIENIVELQNNSLQRLAAIETVLGSRNFEALFHSLSEKVAIMASSDPEVKRGMEDLREREQDLDKDLHTLQHKVETMAIRVGTNDSRWHTIFDGAWKLALMMIAGFILWKLGWQSPPSP